MKGHELIAAERERQVAEEGWTPEHDDEHSDAALAVVAASLAVDGTDAEVHDPIGRGTDGHENRLGVEQMGDCWGLVRKHRDDRVRQLTIAGALIAAEIDREQRREAPDG